MNRSGKRSDGTIRWLVASTTVILLIGLSNTATLAQDGSTATITLHVAECPAGYAGNDLFGDCHANRLAGVTFQWLVAAPGAPSPSRLMLMVSR